jgi:hypothetical protein
MEGTRSGGEPVVNHLETLETRVGTSKSFEKTLEIRDVARKSFGAQVLLEPYGGWFLRQSVHLLACSYDALCLHGHGSFRADRGAETITNAKSMGD